MSGTVSSKGQITVPIEIRRALGLSPGTRVRFELSGDRAVLRKETPSEHPVDRVFGVVRTRRSVDRLLDEMRGPSPGKD